jgi:hypothetical protein
MHQFYENDQMNRARSFPPPHPSPARGEGEIQSGSDNSPPPPRWGRVGVGVIGRTLPQMSRIKDTLG